MIAPLFISPFNNRAKFGGGGGSAWTLGRAIKFDGVNDYVQVNNLSGVAVDADKFGFHVWLKLPVGWNAASVASGATIFGTSQANGAPKLCFLNIEKNSTTSWRIDCRLYDDSGAFKRQIRKSLIPYGTYADGSILHICGFGLADETAESGFDRQQIWINGVAQNPAVIQNNSITWLTTFGNTNYMGADRAARYYKDQVGDVVIFGGMILTDAIAAALYGGGPSSAGNPENSIPLSNMYLWHKYDEAPTTTACVDSSGNGITGTLINFAGGGNASERPEFINFPTGAIAYYKLETTSILDSVNGYNGVNAGGEVVAGKIDNGIYLDGLLDYVNLDALVTPLASTTQGTWSCWVKPTAAIPASTQMIIAFGDTDANSFITMQIDNAGKLRFMVRNSGTNQWSVLTDSAVFSTGGWTHTCVAMDGVEGKIYIDGVFIAQTFDITTDKTQFFNNIAGLDNGRLGVREHNNSASKYFDGTIDELGIWTRALSATEISNLYNDGAGRQIPPYVATDADAQAWIDKMTNPTITEQTAINTFVIADKASGNWALRDDIWIRSLGVVNGLVGKNKTGTATAGIGWSINGASYNGTTHYIDNNFDLDTDGVNYALSDAQVGVFVKTAPLNASTNILTGSYDGNGFTQFLESPIVPSVGFYVNKNNAGFSAAIVDNAQYDGVYSTGILKVYKNGVDITTSTQPLTPLIPTGYNLYEGARNNAGTADLYSQVEISLSYVAASIGFDHTANNTDIRQLLTDLGVTL